jgi:hypothetical protein
MSDQLPKPVWWKVILGLVIIYVAVDSYINPAPNMLRANNQSEEFGMFVGAIVTVTLGIWLVYSGAKPFWRKTP